ncbi:MAG: flagellar hook-length control protein FliK [Methylobacter sp.]|uniref:flagellar hook-length control protein FliK n=1 Tax=Methylobacter sp. TaxID=2051955 RepID=UPI0027306106|nr:flagellar hook-length control protein FliK [Methylobacter sp.]MDP1665394.1 flagellar hook-length control protein FliK [Methylobacter sp.]MDP1969729.1 flagellar hook-length control protein FliK [Methylobacter sp.]
MIIESANLSSLTSSSSMVESMSPPLIDGGVIVEGFSGALVAQLELLSNIKAGDSLPLQTQDIAGFQSVVGLPATTVDAQDFAALLGNDLPSTYNAKDDIDHEAALAAVTDTLKYIAMGTAPEEKAAVVEQNVKAVIAMGTQAEQNMANVVAAAAPTEQNMKNVVGTDVPVEQSATDVIAESEQGLKDLAMDAPVQMDLEQGSDKPDKKQVEGDAQTAVVENNNETEELLAVAIVLPSVMPAEQAKTTSNLKSADAAKESGLLAFTKPLIGDAKPNQLAKGLDDMQGETAFRQPVQDKQGFNLNYFQSSGQTEKTGRVDQQVLSLEGEKTLSRVGGDITQSNRVIDNKTDVPAMTKSLSHPEWSKDLGERIVWMNSRAMPSAEIRLNPPHLGPISVRVDVSDDQATVVFTAQNAAVRETLEASIPKLREMMSAQQLNLVEANVFQGSASDQGRSQSQNFAQTADSRRQVATVVAADGVDEVEQEIASGRAVVSKGLLSLYA